MLSATSWPSYDAVLSPSDKWRNCVSERLSNLLKVTQPVSKQHTKDLDSWLTAKTSRLVALLSLSGPPPAPTPTPHPRSLKWASHPQH